MTTVSILEIDKLIIDAKSFNDSEEFLNKLSSLVIPFGNKTKKESISYKELFNNDLNQNHRRFIAYSLLRVYSINSNCVTEGIIKHKVLKLIEESTSEVYKYLKIDDKTENYLKESLLGSYISNVEIKINESIDKEFDLLSLNSYKNVILGTINNRVFKPLLNDYTDFTLINKSLDVLFNLLNEYLEGEPLNKYKNYNNIIKYNTPQI